MPMVWTVEQRARQIRVILDITIHEFPCIDLSLDYQDVARQDLALPEEPLQVHPKWHPQTKEVQTLQGSQKSDILWSHIVNIAIVSGDSNIHTPK